MSLETLRQHVEAVVEANRGNQQTPDERRKDIANYERTNIKYDSLCWFCYQEGKRKSIGTKATTKDYPPEDGPEGFQMIDGICEDHINMFLRQ